MSTTKIVRLDAITSTEYPKYHRSVEPCKICNILIYDRTSVVLKNTLSDLLLGLFIKIDETSVETQTSPTAIFYDEELFHTFQKNIKDTCRPYIDKYLQDGGNLSGFLHVLTMVEETVFSTLHVEYVDRDDDSEYIFDAYTKILSDIIMMLSVQRSITTTKKPRPKLIINNHYNRALADQLTTLYASQHKDQIVPMVQQYFEHIGEKIFYIDPDIVYEYMQIHINPQGDAAITMELESFWNAAIIAMTEEILLT